MTLFLGEKDAERAIDLEDLPHAIRLIEEAYRQKAAGKASLHPRLTIQYPPGEGYYSDSSLRLLTGIVPAMDSAAIRVYPLSHAEAVAESGPRVLDYTMGQELLLYYRYSRQMELAAVMANYRIMNVRTAAPTGVASAWLARQDSRVLGVLGSGRHAPWQIAAVCSVRPIEEVRVYSPTRENRERLVRTLAPRVDAQLRAVDSAEEAVRGADIVVTVTNANRPVLDADWLAEGAHVNVIARGEIDEQTVLRANTIACSWREQILRDTPDFRPVPDLIRRGAIDERAFLDLDDVIDAGRRSDDDLTLFLSQGVGMWDAAIAPWVYEVARAKGLGHDLDLAA